MNALIQAKEKDNFFGKTIHVVTNSDSEFYDDTEKFEWHFETERVDQQTNSEYGWDGILIKSRPRVMDFSESISGKEEDERWSQFAHANNI